MKSRLLLAATGLVLVVAAAVAVGCSEDTLQGGSQDLNVAFTPNPSGAGRFDTARFQINKLQALPADPAEAAIFGDARITFRAQPYSADLVLEQPSTYARVALSTGNYVVTLIEFTPLSLVDTNLAPPPYAQCVDGVSSINAQSAPNVPETILFKTPQDDLSGLSFSLSPGQTTLALNVNVPGLIDGYEAAFTCQYVACPGCPVDPAPALTSFNAPAFRAAILANITIE